MFVSNWMTKKVITISPDDGVTDAIKLMKENGIKHIPVLRDEKLKGIISDRDIFEVLVDITGVRHGGHRIFLTIEDRPGSVKEVADIIRKHDFHLQSILTSYEGVKEGYRDVVIRTKGKGNFKILKAELEGTFANVKIKMG